MKANILFGAIVVIGTIAFVVGIFTGVNWLKASACEQQAAVYNVEYRYAYLAGCNYLVDGIWIDSSQYAVVVLGDRP